MVEIYIHAKKEDLTAIINEILECNGKVTLITYSDYYGYDYYIEARFRNFIDFKKWEHLE